MLQHGILFTLRVTARVCCYKDQFNAFMGATIVCDRRANFYEAFDIDVPLFMSPLI